MLINFPSHPHLLIIHFFSGEKRVRLRLGLNFSSLALFLFRHVLSKSEENGTGVYISENTKIKGGRKEGKGEE